MSRSTEVFSISLPKKELQNVAKLAQSEGRTRSELVREAIRRYQIGRDWQYLQAIGEKISTRLGIETEEDVERIAG